MSVSIATSVQARKSVPKPKLSTKPKSAGGLQMTTGFDECSFGAFGVWSSSDMFVSGAKNHWALAKWMARNEAKASSVDELWQLCVAANLAGFKRYRAMNLFDKSLNLTAGNVVFEYIVDPSHIPDNPPPRIVARMLKAILEHRDSTLYFLEPVFKVMDVERPSLVSGAEIQELAEQERMAVCRLHARYRRGLLACGYAQAKLKAAVDAFQIWAERRATSRELAKIRARGKMSFSGFDFDREVLRRESLSQKAARLGMEEAAISLRASIQNLQRIDPILSFTLPESPNLHRFIGHWFWVSDKATGKPRVYVHV